MNFVNEILKNAYGMGACTAITDLTDKIKYCSDLLEEYKQKGIDRVGVIIKDGLNFSTISLVLSLIRCGIKPILINESIKENIKGIIEKENIKIVFYENIIKPDYLKKFDVVINKEPQYFVSVSPYMNVKNEGKIRSLQWYLSFLNSEKEIEDCVCKLYDIEDGKIKEDIVKKEEIKLHKNQFEDLEHKGKWQNTIITSPLYQKDSFLLMTSSLLSNMNLYCGDKNNREKNIIKILKVKPSIINFDNNMMLELYTNEKFKNIDLSFLKKVIVNVDEEHLQVVDELLKKSGFNGEYIDITNLCENQKIIQK